MCYVSFSIKKAYKSNVVYDVIDIDACHLLLGRLLQFDVDAVHMGRDNVY